MLISRRIEINLNGGIISNAGFIKQFSNPGTTIIDSKYVSAWGGIQSAGQFVGQVVRRPYISMCMIRLSSQLTNFSPAPPIRHGEIWPQTCTLDHLGYYHSSKPGPIALYRPTRHFLSDEEYAQKNWNLANAYCLG